MLSQETIEVYWKEQIKLGKRIETVNKGEVTVTTDFSNVFANKISIRQSEYYESAKVGLRPEIAFAIRLHVFDNHDRVEYKGKLYEIVRTYENQANETFEIYLSNYTGTDI